MSLANFHDMGGMGGGAANATAGGGGMSMGGTCKISMLWNWTTIDACFLSRSWHVKTKGAFAGSVIGVFFLCMAIEALRRAAREYDRKLSLMAAARRADVKGVVEVSWVQQVVRAVMYGSQFTGAFLVMLLGMYYNGFILFAIFLGHTLGYFFFGRDTCGDLQTGSGCAC